MSAEKALATSGADSARVVAYFDRFAPVTNPARAGILPNLPTISEAGVPGYAITLWIAIYAPAGTPAPVVARLNKEVQRALNQPDVREQMTLQGAEVAVGSPADLLAATKSDLKKMGELVKLAKIVPQ